MGVFKTSLGVRAGNGGDIHWVEATVDTGATFTVLPASLLREQIGVHPTDTEVFTFADGSKQELQIGEARLRINGRERPSIVVFGAEGQFLLGATSLQNFGLVADTSRHHLVPADVLPL